MDKRKVIYNAVAGSGKTTEIINKLNENERSLILTYTNNNEKVLTERVINKFGYIPDNIVIKKIYTFLYSFCLKPFLPISFDINGITYLTNDNYRIKSNTLRYYFTDGRYIYNNKISKLILDKEFDFIDRLNKFFDNIFIDEFQDLASDEIDIALKLFEFSGNVYLYGDYFQTTYSTSSRGNKNKGIKKDIDIFLNKYKLKGYEINNDEFIFSKRCPQSVTEFVTNKINIEMKSCTDEIFDVRLLEDKEDIQNVLENDDIPKLFYQKSNDYNVFSMNWGESKGLTFGDVCVVLNKTTYKNYISGTLMDLVPTTKNKFYVACTRCTRNLYFVEETKIKQYKM
ncbi:hypothetical protein [Macrococcus animalis]|uniref:hypothetical protein n=1 Tax=Macrococcus animalis TaxID=3395467 RepID=UPI0039BE496D